MIYIRKTEDKSFSEDKINEIKKFLYSRFSEKLIEIDCIEYLEDVTILQICSELLTSDTALNTLWEYAILNIKLKDKNNCGIAI